MLTPVRQLQYIRLRRSRRFNGVIEFGPESFGFGAIAAALVSRHAVTYRLDRSYPKAGFLKVGTLPF